MLCAAFRADLVITTPVRHPTILVRELRKLERVQPPDRVLLAQQRFRVEGPDPTNIA